MAMTSLELCPSAAAQEGLAILPKADPVAARRVRRSTPPIPLAAFGALAGAVASIAAAERQRETYYGPYYSPYHGPYNYGSYRRPQTPLPGPEPASAPPLVTRPASGTL
jgi:hypothetical protein